ncbi:MAG TPA: hypothetical protein VGE02_12790 [Gemmatimonadales bacterium]
MSTALAHQAARAQALLDRIADVSDVSDVPLGRSDEPASIDQIMAMLDAREALLADLQPVVAELSMVRGQIASHGAVAAEARAFDLAIAPVEVAARRALGFHEQLLEKMQAMRDELLWELDRMEQLDTVAEGYLGAAPSSGMRLDVRR